MQRTLSIVLICMLALCGSKGTALTDSGEEWLYLGQHTTLAAGPPRQLTLNASVVQFEYSPDGHSLAYVADSQDPDAQPELGVVSTTMPSPQRSPRPTVFDNLGWGAGGVQLGDWTGDGAFLAVSATVRMSAQGSDDTSSPEAQQKLECIDLLKNKASLIPAPEEPGQRIVLMLPGSWAPNTHILAYSTLTTRGAADDPQALANSRGSQLVLYDADSAQARVVADRDGSFMRALGWGSDHQLYFSERKSGQRNANFCYDLHSGKTTDAGSHVHTFTPNAESGLQTISIQSGISLSIESDTAKLTDSAHQSHGVATRLWVVRQGAQRESTDTSAPPRLGRPILLVDTYPVAANYGYGNSCPPRFRPLGIFGRESKYQVAYVSHGDLKVVDLSPRAATPREVYAGGDELACPDELQLALENAKQIGLAVLMYSQDYDETFPSGANFSKGVQPYLQDSSITQLGGYQFQYEPPAKLGLADVESPADLVIGEFDMPCGKVKLYCDGHAKVSQ